MTNKEIKSRIRRRIRKGTFNTVNAPKFNIKATARALERSRHYYTELKEDGMLAYNTLTGKLTIYLNKD